MSTDILYYGPGTCSLVPHIALLEAGAVFEARRVVLMKGEHLQPDFLAINPKARVPVLVHEGQVLTEVLAIVSWIDARYPQAALLPINAWARARAMEWLAWLNGTVHGTFFASVFRPGRFVADESLHPALQARGREQVAEAFAQIEQRLADNGYALDSGYSLVDVYLLVLYRWGVRIGLEMRATYPRCAALVDRLLARPAVAHAFASEGLDPAELA